MSFAQKMHAWMPLHENGASRAVHLLGGQYQSAVRSAGKTVEGPGSRPVSE
jgi:hypothetical protein